MERCEPGRFLWDVRGFLVIFDVWAVVSSGGFGGMCRDVTPGDFWCVGGYEPRGFWWDVWGCQGIFGMGSHDPRGFLWDVWFFLGISGMEGCSTWTSCYNRTRTHPHTLSVQHLCTSEASHPAHSWCKTAPVPCCREGPSLQPFDHAVACQVSDTKSRHNWHHVHSRCQWIFPEKIPYSTFANGSSLGMPYCSNHSTRT